MEVHNIEVVRDLLLQREVLGNVGKGASGMERSSVLKAEVLFEFERGDLGGSGDIGEVVDLFLGGVVTDFLEAMVGISDRDDVVVEVRLGNLSNAALATTMGANSGRTTAVEEDHQAPQDAASEAWGLLRMDDRL
ncbi:hypothetical protein LR48_Vigan06g087200 [Vigna angularis]|nr:hypothetical protein LR48_Vigan06g087200 [Vigna angularis]BAT99586.1 hypothetical protein VIGAN_10104400 [Vigna angularis var. angularis]